MKLFNVSMINQFLSHRVEKVEKHVDFHLKNRAIHFKNGYVLSVTDELHSRYKGYFQIAVLKQGKFQRVLDCFKNDDVAFVTEIQANKYALEVARL